MIFDELERNMLLFYKKKYCVCKREFVRNDLIMMVFEQI